MLPVSVHTLHFILEAQTPDGCLRFSNSDTGLTNDARTLTMPAVDDDDPNGEKNDAEKCIQSCNELGYSFAGMEGATECCTYFTWPLL